MPILLRFVLLFLLAPSLLSARVHLVTPGSSIQVAIDSSGAGDSILVASGTYKELLDFKGKAIVVQGEAPQSTVIDAEGLEGSCVVFQSGEGHDSVLQGFQITGGSGSTYHELIVGGGIFVLNAQPTIRGNIIVGNDVAWPGVPSTTGRGGAVMCIGDDGQTWQPVISDNQIIDNDSGTHGGGIGVWKWMAPTISHNYFTDNKARGRIGTNPGDGGGIWISTSAQGIEIVENVITRCGAEGKGGGIYAAGLGVADQPRVTVARNVFFECVAENVTKEYSHASTYGGLGGAALWMGFVNATVSNNSFVKNDCQGSHENKHQGTLAFEGVGIYAVERNLIVLTERGGGIACEGGGALQASDNAFWMNTHGDHPQCSSGQSGTDSHGDPYLCDPTGSDDPTLAANSPALLHSGGHIGARPIPGCEAVHLQQTTWGTLKMKFE